MEISKRLIALFFGLLILFNILLRFQIELFEIGVDSFFVHVLVNSLSEFGYAKWYLNPLSLAGLYPYSYSSSVPFLLSGVSQTTNISMQYVIFIYCQILGFLSILTGYLLASKVTDNELIRIISSLFFSISLAIVGYSTLTIPTRGLLIVLAPLIFYFLVNIYEVNKKSFYILFFLLSSFLFVTHHLFYFLIPLFLAFVFLKLMVKFRLCRFISETNRSFLILIGFMLMFAIPFITGKFLESSRYAPLFTSYLRYVGIPLFYSIGGIVYLTFKSNKKYSEYLLTLTMVFLTIFIYKLTYMKMFIPVFLIPFAGYGFNNFINSIKNKKKLASLVVFSLLITTSFVSYYQFLHEYDSDLNRNLEMSSYMAGNWMKEYAVGNAISNNDFLGMRIFSVAETTHFIVLSSVSDQIYGFIEPNVTEFERYPLHSEDFWYSGYSGPDPGNDLWADLHRLRISPDEYNLTYIVEDTSSFSNVVWNHSPFPSELVKLAHDESGCVFDNGRIQMWKWN